MLPLELTVRRPAAVRYAGITGPDQDCDSLPDDLESRALAKWSPPLYLTPGEELFCTDHPVALQVRESPHWLPDYRIHGSVQIRPSTRCGTCLEVHWYHIWSRDCGSSCFYCFNAFRHAWDAEGN